MNGRTTPAELEALRARVAALEAALTVDRGRHRRRSRGGRWLGAALVLLLALAPSGVFGASFVDLNPGSPHNADISAIADAGISKGCTDQQHYCPNGAVTREQMASFLARTAGLGGNPPWHTPRRR